MLREGSNHVLEQGQVGLEVRDGGNVLALREQHGNVEVQHVPLLGTMFESGGLLART
jgi:hypothetical protein